MFLPHTPSTSLLAWKEKRKKPPGYCNFSHAINVLNWIWSTPIIFSIAFQFFKSKLRNTSNHAPAIKNSKKKDLFIYLEWHAQVTCGINDYKIWILPKIWMYTFYLYLKKNNPFTLLLFYPHRREIFSNQLSSKSCTNYGINEQFKRTHIYTHTHTYSCSIWGAFWGFRAFLKDMSVMEWNKTDQWLTVHYFPARHEEQATNVQPRRHSLVQ